MTVLKIFIFLVCCLRIFVLDFLLNWGVLMLFEFCFGFCYVCLLFCFVDCIVDFDVDLVMCFVFYVVS